MMRRRVTCIQKRSQPAVFTLAISLCLILALIFNVSIVRAAELQNRSVQLSTAVPSVVATHSFGFIYQTIGLLGSIDFEYCDNSPILTETCTAPPGLDVTSANLDSQSGNEGFSIDAVDTTANKIVISRIPSQASALTPSTYVFSNIMNPSTPGQTVFVRISSYASTNGSGSIIDSGAVAFVIATRFTVGAYVPPFLQLCVGITVTPNCSSISGDTVDLGVLSAIHANAGQSQFATGTNSPTGYMIYSLGTTMTSGNNIIPALTFPSSSFPGSGQFGINLRANLSPPIGEDPVGTGVASPTPNYNIPNRFMFADGDSIVTAPQPSDYNRMTVSYLVNVPSSQPVGVYSTTITYLAVAQF